MLPLSRLIIRHALPRTMSLLTRTTITTGLAAAIHHQSLYTLGSTLIRSVYYGIRVLNLSFISKILPAGITLDLKIMRRVLISAVIAKIFKYIVLATFWIPFRGTILEIILNEIGGNTNLVKSILRALNNVTIPWLQEVSHLIQWVTNHVQPGSALDDKYL